MGKKLLVSLAMEGKLHVEGLQAMDEDDDLLTAMARELVTRQAVGQNAAEIWKGLTKVRETANGISMIEQAAASQRSDIPMAPDAAKGSNLSTGGAVQLPLF
jgi:hypothetical protein